MSWWKINDFWVVVITGLVLAVLLFAPIWLGGGFKTHYDSRQSYTITWIAMIETGLEAFWLDNERFPTQEEGLEALLVGPNDLVATWDGPYIDEKKLIDAWGYRIIYGIPAIWSDEDYDVISYGADGKLGGEGEDADIFNGD